MSGIARSAHLSSVNGTLAKSEKWDVAENEIGVGRHVDMNGSTCSFLGSTATAPSPSRQVGRSVAVAAGIPTETVRLALSGSGKHWRGDVIAVLDRAAERETPRCPVVETCGGCEWQHLNHEGQLKHKAAIVRRLMAAKRLPTRIDEIVPMPDPWSYRVRAQIALGASAGFRELRSKRIVQSARLSGGAPGDRLAAGAAEPAPQAE